MRTVQLDESASGQLDAAGQAQVRIGPTRHGQRWRPTNLAVSSSSVTDTQARLYAGAVAPGNLLGGTYSGNQSNTDLSVTLTAGQALTVVWSGGTPGAGVTVSVNGTMEVPG